MIRLWLSGLIRQRWGRLLGMAAGVALGVGLLASLGAFLSSSTADMTAKAIASLPVDWQVQLVGNADPDAVAKAASAAFPPDRQQGVGYADVAGFEAQSGGTNQATGPGKALGLDLSYRQDFPDQLRGLLGAFEGVLLAQQTAANLHVGIGDHITVKRIGLAPVELTVGGIVDLPNADSLFQAVGAPAGAALQAPPDNVVLLPMTAWHQLFDPQSAVRPDTVKSQIHIRLRRSDLPADPEMAYLRVANAGRNFEVRMAGSALLANNLQARLDAVRGDSLYARLLFLFLGAPGALLAFMLSAAVAAAGADQRRRDLALLRVRGIPARHMLILAAGETLLVGGMGIGAGVLLAWLLSSIVLRASLWAPGIGWWFAAAAFFGLAATAASLFLPVCIGLRKSTASYAVRSTEGIVLPFWRRGPIDAALLLLAAILFWRSQASGYQIVLAPEGVPQTAVDYYAFLAPLALWLGLALLAGRLLHLLLHRWRGRVSAGLRPLAGRLAASVAAALARQRMRLSRNVVLLLIAFSFATSTAIFDTTYNAQSLVDAQLTNGADVSVTGASVYPDLATRLAALPGVAALQPMQHRYAYVGNDLQDLYGIDARHIAEATSMSDAYFQSAGAGATLAQLAATPDGVLVSEETVSDYQLNPGDLINLRLQSAVDHQYHIVAFHFIGVVREFPTAPRDSFLVANAAYVAAQTNSNAADILLLRAARDPALLATEIRRATADNPGVRTSDLGSSLRLIQSSLVAVDLSGLTRIELVFAILMAAGAAGIIFLLNIADRQRLLVILWALGASPPQIAAFVWGEAAIVLGGGLVLGLAAGFGVAIMLVRQLTSVFDPPPQTLTVPWVYLAILIAATAASIVSAAIAVLLHARRSPLESLKSV
jgi:putative ABC transport system permease protein